MLRYSEATIKHMGVEYDENSTPLNVFKESKVRAVIDKTFSNRYYNDRGRSQRLSKNIVVNEYVTKPFDLNGVNYTIYSVVIDDIEYRVKDLLTYYKDQRKVILDCEQLMK